MPGTGFIEQIFTLTPRRPPPEARVARDFPSCLWMDAIHFAHHFETMGNPLFVGMCTGIIPGFLRWCRISSIQSIFRRLARLPKRREGFCSQKCKVLFRACNMWVLHGFAPEWRDQDPCTVLQPKHKATFLLNEPNGRWPTGAWYWRVMRLIAADSLLVGV